MDTISRLNENLSKLDAVRKTSMDFLASLVDDKSFVETGTFASGAAYADGVEAQGEGIVTGYATIFGIPVYLFVQNFEAMKGSFSVMQAKKIESVVKASVKNGVPFVSVIDSAGARLDEGTSVLEGYAGIIKLAASMKGVVPHIAVVTGACAGLMSDYANMADVLIVGKNGYISQGSPSVVLAKEKKTCSPVEMLGSDNALSSGMAALTFESADELKNRIADVLTFLTGAQTDGDNPNKTAKTASDVKSAFAAVADKGSVIELYKGYSLSTATFFARVGGNPVGVLCAEGLLCCDDFKKIKRFVNLLDSYGIPLITLVDSEGINNSYDCETHGLSRIASEAFTAMALSDNPKISVIVRNSVGGAYALLSSKGIGFDYTLAFSDACVAPLSGEQAVNFYDEDISGDPVKCKEKLKKDYTFAEGNPFLSAKEGYIDNVIDGREIKPYVASALNMLL